MARNTGLRLVMQHDVKMLYGFIMACTSDNKVRFRVRSTKLTQLQMQTTVVLHHTIPIGLFRNPHNSNRTFSVSMTHNAKEFGQL